MLETLMNFWNFGTRERLNVEPLNEKNPPLTRGTQGHMRSTIGTKAAGA